MLFYGRVISAVTLAGAAEEVLPESPRPYLIKTVLTNGPEYARTRLGMLEETSESVVNRFNDLRNWLKHYDRGEQSAFVELEDAVIMILRAGTKLDACYGAEALPSEWTDFEEWFKKNYSAWLAAKI